MTVVGPIGVVGLGYVGLPLAVAFAEAGGEVVGHDIADTVLTALRGGRSHVEDVTDEALAAVAGRVTFTADPGALSGCDAVLICVPTPLTVNREPDLGPLRAAVGSVAASLRPGQLVVLESTTYPGTTREVVCGALERTGMVAGRDFHVAYSPERVDPGSGPRDPSVPKLVGGVTPACGERAVRLYGRICERVVPVSSSDAAELAKLLENVFRAVNIALVNELAMLADRMGIDVWEVVDAAATKPFGFMRFDPGPGMGGHCLPVDPFYLSWRARQFDFPMEFVELAGKLNQAMPYYCLSRIERRLNDAGLPVRGSRILLVGVSYKGGVGDLRESPALKILRLLRERGAQVRYHDPHVPEVGDPPLRTEPDLTAAARACDLAVIVTAHPDVDHATVASAAPAVLDLRNATPAGDWPAVERL
jgi:UDP-N-acetyl-D-glucosamine dehydrogenase